MKIKDYYDELAPEYEKLINSPEINVQIMSEVKKLFSKYKITEGRLLDIGCGPGNLKTALGDKFVYTGIDISGRMLTKAKEKGYITIPGKIEDELKIIPDKSFDYVISLSVLHFVKDIGSVIQEFDRISKKGWLASLADVTENYAKNSVIDEPLYNHSSKIIHNTLEDYVFDAWISLTKEKMRERMIFKGFQ